VKLPLYFPVKPNTRNQDFGANPSYYAKFKDNFGNPLQGHDGIDFHGPHGTPVYAAHDGLAQYQVDAHGGDGFLITTETPFDYKGGQAHLRSMYWHLCAAGDPQFPPKLATNGTLVPVKAGDLIGYADNTGAPYESSGDHLHFGLIPVDVGGDLIEAKNGFNGRIDPTPYFDGFYAQDIEQVLGFYELLVPKLQEIVHDLWSRLQMH
jgi:murein DD-endopeptidase MepM/ murein hydrolase activator NlpD